MRAKIAALLALALVALVGCAQKPGGGHHITIGVGGQSLPVYLPLTLAQRLGFFDHAGVDVRIEDMQGGSKALQALQGGSVDVVAGYYDHTIQMQAKNRAVTSFVTMLDRPELVLAVSPATHRPIASVADLRGANVGVTAPGSSSHFFLQYLLARSGTPADAVSVQAIGGAATAVAAMENGRVDAAAMVDPAFSLLQQRAGADRVRVLTDTRTAEGVRQTFGVSDYPAAVLYSTPQWLGGNDRNARALATAIVRTLRWIDRHTAEQIAAEMPAEYAQDNRAVYIDTIAKMKDGFSRDGRMPTEGAEAVRRVLAQSDPEVAKADIDLSRTYSDEYLPTDGPA
ncbi:ABC transporter substrate-binding protein [Nocardia terpenica]|uniref:Transporter substrate-binding domain-containing protein n=1 Tax=Nocardia terpenica TaxID=455432 RepID=A0A6G9Z785_9NOCA|nr:ABC transporter substrate-binding protein [Nocardia terpenica]QIS21310.1 transporter substrate-binding domain-containing protein [Nocardia terpenica]